jgi:glycosyltransferase involved in cell wall biosynthesis
MPNYNKGGYVKEAIESILSQTYENWELIIVDDGSTDDSPEIIEEYARKEPRIVSLRQGHKGVSAAHNLGFGVAKGDLIARQDSDDNCSKERLAKQVAVLDVARPSVCYTDGWVIDDTGKSTGEIYNRDRVQLPKAGFEGDVFGQLLRNGWFILHASIMAHRDCYTQDKLDTRYDYAEDWDLSVRLARRYRFRYIPEPLYGYRIYAGNSWRQANLVRNMRGQAAIQREWLKEFNLSTTDRKVVMRRIVRDEFLTDNYWGLAKLGLSSLTGLRVLTLESIGETRNRKYWRSLRNTLRVDRQGRVWLWRNAMSNLKLTLGWPLIGHGELTDLTAFEQRIFSQHGEDGILRAIFKKLGDGDRSCAELGVEGSEECNTRHLAEKAGWHSLITDTAKLPSTSVKNRSVSPENVNTIFHQCRVPPEFDFLSVNLDYNAYWVWKAMEGYHPRVVAIGYNAFVPPGEKRAVKYDPNGAWNKRDDYFGASISAMEDLGREKGYTLVACDSAGASAFFVRKDLVPGNFRPASVRELYRRSVAGSLSHSSKEWASLDTQQN